MNMFTLVRDTFGPAERKALRRAVLWEASAFALVAGGYLAAGLGLVAGAIDGVVFAGMAGAAGLLAGLQDGGGR